MAQVLQKVRKGRLDIRTLATVVVVMALFASLLGVLATSRPAEAADFSGASEFKLTDNDGAASDAFGRSVAISGDTAVVSAYYDVIGANTDQGSAYIFVRNGTTWSQQAKITANDGTANDTFGASVALSGDTIVVGADHDDVGANTDQGSAYVFVRTGTIWSQQAQLTASDGTSGDSFGASVALSGDSVVVGAYDDDVGANENQGSAYIFVRNGTTWSQQAKLTASDGAAGDYFGSSVAISRDTVVVGASIDDVGANENQGSTYIFVRNGTTWSQQAKLIASDGAAGDYFGVSVALSGDTIVVGADRDDFETNMEHGSAYIFVRNGTTWSQQAKLAARDGTTGDMFGVSVALSGDTVVVGAHGDDVGANEYQGSAYIFMRNGTIWSQQAHLTANDGAAGDYFGMSVALSGDTVVVGAHGDDVGANKDQGSAYVYKLLDVDFSAVPLSGTESVAVYFTGLSWSYAGITSWSWDFGDGNYSNQQNPTHQYAQEGSYTVSLTVTDADTYSNTETKIDYITITDAGPTADFWAMPLDSSEPLTITFTDLSTSYDSIISWSWNFGDGESSSEQNPTHQYTRNGIYTVMLTITEADGDRDMEAKIVNTNVTDGTPPYTSGHNPDKYATGIPIDTNIMVHVIDDGIGVDQTSIVMTVKGIVVTPVITGSSSDYMLIYHPPSEFGYKVDVTINASDLAGNIMPTDSYSFTTTALLMEGDVNLDGYVTITDAMLIARFKAGLLILTEAQLKCADTTDDGIVSMADAMHISQWLVDPNGSLGVLFKPLWQSPADDSMLKPIPK